MPSNIDTQVVNPGESEFDFENDRTEKGRQLLREYRRLESELQKQTQAKRVIKERLGALKGIDDPTESEKALTSRFEDARNETK